jgi:hypothetical protein
MTIAIGDTVGDIPMLDRAAFPIAFNPDNGLLFHAYKYSWTRIWERKNSIEILRHDRCVSVETILPRQPNRLGALLRQRLQASGVPLLP